MKAVALIWPVIGDQVPITVVTSHDPWFAIDRSSCSLYFPFIQVLDSELG